MGKNPALNAPYAVGPYLYHSSRNHLMNKDLGKYFKQIRLVTYLRNGQPARDDATLI
jgi:hypothetical protein